MRSYLELVFCVDSFTELDLLIIKMMAFLGLREKKGGGTFYCLKVTRQVIVFHMGEKEPAQDRAVSWSQDDMQFSDCIRKAACQSTEDAGSQTLSLQVQVETEPQRGSLLPRSPGPQGSGDISHILSGERLSYTKGIQQWVVLPTWQLWEGLDPLSPIRD